MRKQVTYRKANPDPTSAHVALWVDTEQVPGRRGGAPPAVRPTARRLWSLAVLADQVLCAGPTHYTTPAELAECLRGKSSPRVPIQVWIPRGWESLCMSGLADLIESGELRCSRLTIDGDRSILIGRLGEQPLRVTCLTAWTGGAWDGWADKVLPELGRAEALAGDGRAAQALAAAPEGERILVGTVSAILRGCLALCLGKPTLGIGSMARRWWACWGGPTLREEPRGRHDRRTKRRPPARRIVIPSPRRPRVAAQAEQHVAHGLVREQYYRGHVGARVHVLDLEQAYLVALAVADLPAVYDRTEHSMDVDRLRGWCARGDALALCRVEGARTPAVQWRARRPRRIVGSYYAWLSGPDLERQLAADTVREVNVAHLWRTLRHSRRSRDYLLSVRGAIRSEVGEWLLPLWRGLYSALAGAWNQTCYRWVDSPHEFRAARWATFLMPGANPDGVDRYRVVAGKVQKRECYGEAPHACPFAYATVTSVVRDQVDWLREELPEGSVLATACDALWVTDTAIGHLRACSGGDPEDTGKWAIKETYDDAWMDGRGRAVVERDGALYPLTAGVPSSAALDDDGYARWQKAESWGASADASPDRPQLRLPARWDGGKIVRDNSGPLEPARPWLTLDEPYLHEDLLLPFDTATTGDYGDD